jgi:flagellar protein FlgJ
MPIMKVSTMPEIQSATPTAAGTAVTTPNAAQRKLKDAAQQFESFFVGYLLKEMRKGSASDEKGGLFTPSEGEKVFRDMMDDETARSISKTGQLGMADLLYKELAPSLQSKKESGGPA